ncbi:MAG: tRNA (N(6)-L-threonylcarbamoyladenosine(37)-C(2))-methylthiotransferase MtaB [Oscillospiraceae bacterium]|jgi:threonylcarbamoyladenosine tRNA methylthiotransferase MtaB|nr:tRNA (N(6)-L-threonylcarbamoyladenosine(37)-C(2))-methylthiotransferase MtaB [Oscillospiraceae bacterium]
MSGNSAAFYTLGCKVNQAETRRLADLLRARGWHIFDSNTHADVYIINSCAVTAESARKTRQAVRRFKKNNPDATVALIGCVPSVANNLGEELPEADLIVPQAEKDRLPEFLEQIIIPKNPIPNIQTPCTGIRAAVKIQDGCNSFCSYCVIPLARGRACSVPLNQALDECRTLINGGAREIILTGINLSTWGREFGQTLADAVRAVSALPHLLHLRLGSLEPDLLTPAVLQELTTINNLCPHFHISLQSGSDSVLRRMNRRYASAEFAALCQNLRRFFPGCTITTDIIVGFPGETLSEFEETFSFAQQIAFEKAHIFPYSARPGTRAAAMPNQLPRIEKERRAHLLLDAMSEIRHKFFLTKIGKTLTILPEKQDREGFVHGYTANYIPVRAHSLSTLPFLQTVKITGVDGDFCRGEAV